MSLWMDCRRRREGRFRHRKRALRGLALIVVVLNGLKIAFSGNIQSWELVRSSSGCGYVGELQFYTTTIRGWLSPSQG